MLVPISVVIPAFNASAYLKATIMSIRAQSIPVAEIIVINDGSTDNTGAIAKEAGVVVIDQENAGLPATRNRGIHAASQPWIALADADDLWEPDKIERQWRSLQLVPEAAFSFSDFSQFNDRGIINRSVIHEVHQRHFRGVARSPLGNEAFLCDSVTLGTAMLKQNPFCPSSLMVRRDTAVYLGGYDSSLLAGEDYDFVLRLTRDHVGTYIDVPLVRYRRHPTAMTSNIPRMREAMVDVALRITRHSKEYSPDTSEYFRRRMSLYLLKCGFAHIRYGDQAAARIWLQKSLNEKITFSAVALYPVTFLVERGFGRYLRDAIVQLSGREAFKSAGHSNSAVSL